MGIVLPEKYIKAMGGPGGAGRWAVTPGEQIEEWVKERLQSRGLIDQLERSVYDWQLWIGHYEKELAAAQVRVDKHLAGLAKAKSEAGVRQRTDWLETARADLAKEVDSLEKARKAIAALEEAAKRHESHKVPTVEFEKEFQFMVLLALKQFNHDQVMTAVQTALERVEQGLDIPDATPSDDPSRYEGYKSAGVMDTLTKAWDFLVDKFQTFMDWVAGILGYTKRINKLMDAAGA